MRLRTIRAWSTRATQGRSRLVPDRSSTGSISRHSSWRLATVRGFVVGADGPVSVLLAPQASGGVRRGQILRGGSQRGWQLHDLQRSAWALRGGGAIGRPRRRREDGHAERERHRRQRDWPDDRLAAGRLDLGLHHRRIGGNAGAGRLLHVPRRRARTSHHFPSAAGRAVVPTARARAPRRTAGSRSTTSFPASTTSVCPGRACGR